jgi:hypothetical protein
VDWDGGGSPDDAIKNPRGHGVVLSSGDLPRVQEEDIMADQKPAKNVQKLIADKTKQKPAKRQPTVAKEMRMRKKPKPKKQPSNVLKLITDALRRKGQ